MKEYFGTIRNISYYHMPTDSKYLFIIITLVYNIMTIQTNLEYYFYTLKCK